MYTVFLYWASPLQAKKVKLACLKGLTHEIGFKILTKVFRTRLKVRDAAGFFFIFKGLPMIL